MNNIVKVRVIEIKPTHVLIKLLSTGQEIKTSTRFFQKRVETGMYEVVNQSEMPSVI